VLAVFSDARQALVDLALHRDPPADLVDHSPAPPAEIPAVSARYPHCGDLNVFPHFGQILAYACQHSGQGVGTCRRR
jgi:hypothetical protein